MILKSKFIAARLRGEYDNAKIYSWYN